MKMLKINSKSYTLLWVLIASIVLVSCSKDDAADSPVVNSKSGIESLNGQEKDVLVYLAEKEKLHKEVYQIMYEEFENPVYEDLYKRDNNMMWVLSDRIDKYELPNPLLNKAVGEFEHIALQHSFVEFISKLELGEEQALVFIYYLELEMVDYLEEYFETGEGNQSLAIVFKNLEEETIDQSVFLDSEFPGIKNYIASYDMEDDEEIGPQ